MGALSLGLEVGSCVVLGSGAYNIADLVIAEYKAKGMPVGNEKRLELQGRFFSHHEALAGVSLKGARRFFIVGNSTDPLTPFRQQVRYAESLQRAGHNVRLVETGASRGDDHTFAYESLRATALCLKGADDRQIGRALGGAPRAP
jgi:hypothetical protein